MQTIHQITTHLQQIILYMIGMLRFAPPSAEASAKAGPFNRRSLNIGRACPPFPVAIVIAKAGLPHKAKYIKTKTIYVLGKNKFIHRGCTACGRLLRGDPFNFKTGKKCFLNISSIY